MYWSEGGEGKKEVRVAVTSRHHSVLKKPIETIENAFFARLKGKVASNDSAWR
jgi:hypothetical protein